jgi:hypothetical protein
MTNTTRTFGLGLALLLSACGGGGSSNQNAATGAAFTYGTSQAATTSQVGAMGATVASLDAFKAAPTAAAGLGAVDGGSVTGSLLKGSVPTFSPSSLGATDASAFDVPACAVVTPGQVAFNHCRVTVDETQGTSTTKGSASLNGHVTLAADGKTLDWDLSFGANVTSTDTASSTGTVTISADLHSAGHVVVTDTTAVGTMAQEVSLTISAGGQSASAAVDESVAFDVTRAASCGSGVTGGTLEAKRVWTARPSGATSTTLPDQALKIAWTGCGTGTVQAGTR